jgi:endonuclease YncB( thermonuclease family)
MAKEEAAEGGGEAPEAAERRKAAEQQFWQTARARKKKKTTGRIILVVGGLALGASIAAATTLYVPGLFAAVVQTASAPTASSSGSAARVAKAPQGPQPLTGPAKAVDGATLTVAGQTVRLQGVQAPPASLVCKTNVMEYRCGDIARRVLDSFAGGAPVACMPASPGAAAGTVAICRNRRGWDLAAMQVEAGWAIIQGTSDSSPYRAEQSRAQANGAGLWPGFVKPEQWSQASR